MNKMFIYLKDRWLGTKWEWGWGGHITNTCNEQRIFNKLSGVLHSIECLQIGIKTSGWILVESKLKRQAEFYKRQAEFQITNTYNEQRIFNKLSGVLHSFDCLYSLIGKSRAIR